MGQLKINHILDAKTLLQREAYRMTKEFIFKARKSHFILDMIKFVIEISGCVE